MFKKIGYDSEIDRILNIEDTKSKYEAILDYISNYLIKNKKIYDMCDFKDNKCIANRLNKSIEKEDGCCYIFKKGKCDKLKNKKCSIDCITCKLFICDYLEKKYGKINLNDIFPVNKVFNKKQQYIIKSSFFKDKKEIINILLNK